MFEEPEMYHEDEEDGAVILTKKHEIPNKIYIRAENDIV